MVEIKLPYWSNMEVSKKRQIIRDNFPVFQQFELVSTIAENSQYIKVPKGGVILDIGDFIKVIPLVISGSIKVFREDEDAREAFLYYINPGESCAITLASANKPGISKIKAIALEDSELLALSVNALFDVNTKYPNWFSFVNETFRKRFDELIHAFESVVFLNLDRRLVVYLKRRSDAIGSMIIKVSHSEIARDLATSREVISRILKQLEKEKILLLSRGQITLL